MTEKFKNEITKIKDKYVLLAINEANKFSGLEKISNAPKVSEKYLGKFNSDISDLTFKYYGNDKLPRDAKDFLTDCTAQFVKAVMIGG